jgi:hypothetical protein
MIGGARRRRPIWQRSRAAKLSSALEKLWKGITFPRLGIALFVLPAGLYLFNEVTRETLVIDPFSVPKRFEEMGLSPEVVASRVGDALRQIETTTETTMRKDNLSSLHDEGSTPDVEIPGTKLGLKAVVDLARAVFQVYPKHVGGDIVIAPPTNAASGSPLAKVDVYITQGRNRSAAMRLVLPGDNIDSLSQSVAEAILDKVNPYVLAVFRFDHGESEIAVELSKRIIRDPSSDRSHVVAAFVLWGNVFAAQKNYDAAIANFEKAIALTGC